MYLFMYICVHFCIFVYISVYSHLSSKDAPHDLRQRNPWRSIIFLDAHQLSKIFKNFQMSKNVKNWHVLTPRRPSDSPDPPKINFLMNFQKFQNRQKSYFWVRFEPQACFWWCWARRNARSDWIKNGNQRNSSQVIRTQLYGTHLYLCDVANLM